MTSREALTRAKVEHYLSRAEEYVEMARFIAAGKVLENVCRLDTNNKEVARLQQRIGESLQGLAQKTNGHDIPENIRRMKHPEVILVVDQDERLLLALATHLKHYGYDAISAAGYEEAVETLSTVKPDVVVSEVNFESGSRGFDLYLQCKTDAAETDLPFVFLTARLDKEMLIAGKRLGVDDFLVKPVDADIVAASVQSCLARRKKRSA